MVTISDVAAVARVSKKTVSRVINNHPDVAETTRLHVQQVIEQMGYRPSMLARGLAQGKTHIVGVIIDESAQDVFSYPLYSDTLRGISSVLDTANLDMLVRFNRDETSYVDLYRQRRVDGLILLSMPVDDPQLPVLFDSGTPYVLTQRVSTNGTTTNWVDVDFESGAQKAAAHLVAFGHRRIAFLISPPNKNYVRLLLRGYRATLEAHGVPVHDELIVTTQPYTSVSQDTIAAIMRDPDPPTAFVCSDDLKAVQLLQIMQELGYRIPKDVSVIGCDDALIARYANPSLTTIWQDAFRKGHLAARILLDHMQGTQDDSPTQILLPTQLVVRGSTGPVYTGSGERRPSRTQSRP